jgi:hypothetical protein
MCQILLLLHSKRTNTNTEKHLGIPARGSFQLASAAKKRRENKAITQANSHNTLLTIDISIFHVCGPNKYFDAEIFMVQSREYV